jgi:hypothetical protein
MAPAVGLSAVLIVPLIAVSPHLERTAYRLTHDVATGSQALAPRALVTAIAPGLNLLPPEQVEALRDYQHALPYHPSMRDLHLGILPLMLAALGLGAAPTRRVLALGVLGVLGLFVAFGAHSAVRDWVYFLVPLGDSSRHSAQARLLTLFALCVLATHGLATLLPEKPEAQRREIVPGHILRGWFPSSRRSCSGGLVLCLGMALSQREASEISKATWNLLADEMILNALFLGLLGALVGWKKRTNTNQPTQPWCWGWSC